MAGMVACWFGPPERYRDSDEFMTAPDASVTAYLRVFSAARLPRGLAAFPDGGSPKPANGGAEVFLCHRGENRFHQIGRVYAPLGSKWRYRLRGWIQRTVVLQKGEDSAAIVGIRLDKKVDSAASPVAAANVAPGLHGVALPECKRALDSLKHSDPVLNYTN
jgi:hypothetical protein